MTNANAGGWIIAEIALCLIGLGRLREALPILDRDVRTYVNSKNWVNASTTYQNLSQLNALLGRLTASENAARQAITLAHRAPDDNCKLLSLVILARAKYLQGVLDECGALFEQAEKIDSRINPLGQYLLRGVGIHYCDYLRRIGKKDYSRASANANLQVSNNYHWNNITSLCHRVLGDLDAVSEQHKNAQEHFDAALKIARRISDNLVLIEALLARGRWAAKYMKDAMSAFNDLNEALGYAVEGGYRIYEADIRVALAWAGIADSRQSAESSRQEAVGSRQKAKTEAERALRMSEEMGYYWGKVDAEEVLVALAR